METVGAIRTMNFVNVDCLSHAIDFVEILVKQNVPHFNDLH